MQKEFAIVVKLRQHTPLIHFQYKKDTEEDARLHLQHATLRATEVKPRLDDFIKKHRIERIPPHWLVGKGNSEHEALDYKLQIKANNFSSVTEKEVVTFISRKDSDANKKMVGSYFGDAKGLTWEDGLILTFTSFETDVLDAIYQHIVPFFVLHNFGQRQSKGFGSFTVEEVNNEQVKGYDKRSTFGEADMELILKQYHKTIYKLKKYTNTPLKEVHEEYQLLKAGRNPGRDEDYRKSKLFEYFVNQPSPIRWEKRRIKQEINAKNEAGVSQFNHPLFKQKEPFDYNLNGSDYYSYTDKQANVYKYIRALLGLSETNEYQVEFRDRETGNPFSTKNKKYVAIIDHRPDSSGDEKIERFASPIQFKVIRDSSGYIVYLIPTPEKINKMLNKEFSFALAVKMKREEKWQEVKADGDPLLLKTPVSFNLLTFLNEALDKDIWKLLD